MSSSVPASAAEPFAQTGFADGQTVATLREQVKTWLAGAVEIDHERLCDILLATDEALANCVDHAYRDRDTDANGLMTLRMAYDRVQQLVEISVTDQGCWVEPAARTQTSIRGRGLILMRALADECTIDGGVDGTTVLLRFGACPARGRHACAS